MDKQVLKADKRKITGRKVKSLRKEGILPANIYGKKVKSLAIQVDSKEFEKVFAATGETGIVEIQVGNEKKPSLIHNAQKDPVSDLFIHVDFLQVDLKEKVEAEVAVELIGESSVEKQGLGTVVQYINEVEVEALPADLPDKFTIDISTLTKVDQTVMVKDLKIDKDKVEIKDSADGIIVKVEPPQKVEEEAPPEPVEGEEEAEIPEGEQAEVKEGEEVKEEKPAEEKSGEKATDKKEEGN
ncbi:50S ribosomal protein L25 [Patescibacteria group bacterium]